MEPLTPSNSYIGNLHTTNKHHFVGCARHDMKWEPKLSISTIIHSGIVGYDNLTDASRYQMRGFIADLCTSSELPQTEMNTEHSMTL
jgi:hypothetical protein